MFLDALASQVPAWSQCHSECPVMKLGSQINSIAQSSSLSSRQQAKSSRIQIWFGMVRLGLVWYGMFDVDEFGLVYLSLGGLFFAFEFGLVFFVWFGVVEFGLVSNRFGNVIKNRQ